MENVKLILCHPKRAVAVVENVLFVGLYYNILLWFPYYFTRIGYASHATNFSVISAFLMFFGCLVFESLIKFCPSYCHWVISALLVGATVFQFQMIFLADEPSSAEGVQTFFLLILAESLCLSGPLNTILTTELSFLTADSRKAAMYIFVVHSMLSRMFSMGSMFPIDSLLEISTDGPMQARVRFSGSCSSMCWP